MSAVSILPVGPTFYLLIWELLLAFNMLQDIRTPSMPLISLDSDWLLAAKTPFLLFAGPMPASWLSILWTLGHHACPFDRDAHLSLGMFESLAALRLLRSSLQGCLRRRPPHFSLKVSVQSYCSNLYSLRLLLRQISEWHSHEMSYFG